MGLFFTSDTHWGHKNCIKHDNRPFSNIQDHDAHIIEKWNMTVTDKDDVWHLGDFAFRNKIHIRDYVKRLKGRIHLVRGNHDDKGAWRHQDLFASVQEAKYLKWEGQRIYLLHYACRTWRGSHRGAWHLFGHSHGAIPSYGRSMDVGTMIRDYKPISFDEIHEFMKGRGLIDHHPAEIEALEEQIAELQRRVDFLKSHQKEES